MTVRDVLAADRECAALSDTAYAFGERVAIRLIMDGVATAEVLQEVTFGDIIDAGLLTPAEEQAIIRLGAMAEAFGCEAL